MKSRPTSYQKTYPKSARITLFDETEWEERFDVLIRLTQRTSLIKTLSNCEHRIQRIKDAVDKRLAHMGVWVKKPRGLGVQHTARTFLSKVEHKYDAAYLIGLHYGANGPGSMAETQISLGASLDKKFEVYMRYLRDIHPGDKDSALSFEAYVVLINAVQVNAIPVHKCGDCSSTFVWPTGSFSRAVCPVCMIHRHPPRTKALNLLSELKKQNQLSATGKSPGV